MAVFLFKLPDIGEGIAEAEIVAWHVAVGDRIEEDAQLADMMTDKATVEMESPVAGVVRKLAGEVGDLIAIGSVLVEIETDADTNAVASKDEQPLGDGAVHASAAMEQALPASSSAPPAGAGGDGERSEPGEGMSINGDIPSPRRFAPAPPAKREGLRSALPPRQLDRPGIVGERQPARREAGSGRDAQHGRTLRFEPHCGFAARHLRSHPASHAQHVTVEHI